MCATGTEGLHNVKEVCFVIYKFEVLLEGGVMEIQTCQEVEPFLMIIDWLVD